MFVNSDELSMQNSGYPFLMRLAGKKTLFSCCWKNFETGF